jgi:hypothetical protein
VYLVNSGLYISEHGLGFLVLKFFLGYTNLKISLIRGNFVNTPLEITVTRPQDFFLARQSSVPSVFLNTGSNLGFCSLLELEYFISEFTYIQIRHKVVVSTDYIMPLQALRNISNPFQCILKTQ